MKKSNKSELKKDVGNSHYEKAVPALREGRKAPEINGTAGIVGEKKKHEAVERRECLSQQLDREIAKEASERTENRIDQE